MLASKQRWGNKDQRGGGKDLEAENRMLKQRLSDFMNEAQANEQKLRKFQALELRLIGLNSLIELVRTALYPGSSALNWDVVSLVLFDPGFEIQRVIGEDCEISQEFPEVIFVNSWEDIEKVNCTSMFPTLGPYRPNKHSNLFKHARKRPSSIAQLPLVRYGKLIGCLTIGSYDARRFVRGVRTDFLEHFAAVLAICIENATNSEQLKRQGLTDTLTAINNRRYFDQRLKEEMKTLRRSGKPLSCMLLDVDYFKRVNDTYGHQVGDVVLREVAALIRAQLRGSDVLSRYGGEEFSALLTNTDEEEAVEVAERIRRSIEQHVFDTPEFDPFNVTISIGVATFCLPPDLDIDTRRAGEALVGQSDRVLYDAKAGGRNCVKSTSDVAKVALGGSWG